MSAGAFSDTFYGASYGNFTHPIRVQPETLAAEINAIGNDPPAGPADNPISASVSRSTRSLGLHARLVFAKLAGTPPTGYAAGARVRIPALTAAFFDEATKNATMTYLGTTWTVTGRRSEVQR